MVNIHSALGLFSVLIKYRFQTQEQDVIIKQGVFSPVAGIRVRGKSGLHRAGCRRNSCGCELRESAAEKYTALFWVRVKRWGKSPPAVEVTHGLGKPHPEQDRIGKTVAAR